MNQPLALGLTLALSTLVLLVFLIPGLQAILAGTILVCLIVGTLYGEWYQHHRSR